jgi:hypothetical protein
MNSSSGLAPQRGHLAASEAAVVVQASPGFLERYALNWGAVMTALPVLQARSVLIFRRLIIFTLAGLLIFYHSLTLYEMYLGTGSNAHTLFDHVQSVFRVLITVSLLLVVFGNRRALWGMWFSIGGLVATHYWAHFGNLPVEFTVGRHPLSYLKGFIFPTIITLAFYSSPRQGSPTEHA